MRGLISIIILSILFSCIDKKAEPNEEDVRFRLYNLENQGWKSKLHAEKIDNINFAATEVPIQFYLLKEMGNENLISIDSVYEQNKRERIIEFVFEDEDEKDLLQEEYTQLDYEKSVRYMAFDIQKDFYVVTTSKDTVKCSGVLFERNFKVAPSNKILLFFSNIKPEDKIQLVYEDKLYRKGIIKFNFVDPILNL